MKRSTARKRADKSLPEERARAKGKERRPKLHVVPDVCASCGSKLNEDQTVLFVEEENGRIFCEENCIVTFYTPEIERLEQQYFSRTGDSDFSAREREELAPYRWRTLESPSEVWRNRLSTGDTAYTFLAEYDRAGEPFWSVATSLCLRGEPSFLLLAFVTKSPETLDQYRSGERVEAIRNESEEDGKGRGFTFMTESESTGGDEQAPTIDRLDTPWTQYETFQARSSGLRKKSDIPEGEYTRYETCFEDTLSKPEEVWSYPSKTGDDASPRLFHFIKHYEKSRSQGKHWYVIVARQTPVEDQLEILEAFPTRDTKLVANYRFGIKETLPSEESGEVPSRTRVVH